MRSIFNAGVSRQSKRLVEGVVTPFAWDTFTGISNRALYDLYIGNSIVRANIDYMASSISDIGIKIRDGKTGEIKPSDIDFNIENILKEFIVYGYSVQFYNKGKSRLESVNMADIQYPIYDGNKVIGFQYSSQRLMLKDYPNLIVINSTKFNDLVTNKNSLLYPLLALQTFTYRGKTYSYRVIDLIKAVEYSALQGLVKGMHSKHFLLFEPDTDLSAVKAQLEDLTNSNSDLILMDSLKDIKRMSHVEGKQYGELFDAVIKILNIASQNSFSLLLISQDFTESSAKVTKSLIDERINQYKTVAISALETHFNIDILAVERKEYTFGEVMDMFRTGLITKEEARQMLGLD
ncbi:MAG: hypothetical protein RMJ59_02195 [Candidatus Nitrosocaldus sp.]|nr:hypothetical protein [Candidatus Nitrosocaldus sp.]MDW8000341.1 hypothetical protein [Candidatus Nitrosocaldus sp.]MDW8275178.1 hypothetical protein [Candidatus Nitrosocaldus sp.]